MEIVNEGNTVSYNTEIEIVNILRETVYTLHTATVSYNTGMENVNILREAVYTSDSTAPSA